MARVVLTDEARDDLRDLDGAARQIVLRAIQKLETDPEQRGTALGRELTTYRELVVGDRQYRVIFRVEEDGQVRVVWVVGSRVDSECYDLARARLQLYADPAKAKSLEALLAVAFPAQGQSR